MPLQIPLLSCVWQSIRKPTRCHWIKANSSTYTTCGSHTVGASQPSVQKWSSGSIMLFHLLSRAVHSNERSLCACKGNLQFRPWVFIHVTSTCALASREGLYGFRILPTHRPQCENCVAQIIGPVERFIAWSVKGILHWHLRTEPADLLHSKQKTRYSWPEEVNPSKASVADSFEFQAFNSTLSHKHWPLLLDQSLQNWFEDITMNYQATKLPLKSD